MEIKTVENTQAGWTVPTGNGDLYTIVTNDEAECYVRFAGDLWPAKRTMIAEESDESLAAIVSRLERLEEQNTRKDDRIDSLEKHIVDISGRLKRDLSVRQAVNTDLEDLKKRQAKLERECIHYDKFAEVARSVHALEQKAKKLEDESIGYDQWSNTWMVNVDGEIKTFTPRDIIDVIHRLTTAEERIKGQAEALTEARKRYESWSSHITTLGRNVGDISQRSHAAIGKCQEMKKELAKMGEGRRKELEAVWKAIREKGEDLTSHILSHNDRDVPATTLKVKEQTNRVYFELVERVMGKVEKLRVDFNDRGHGFRDVHQKIDAQAKRIDQHRDWQRKAEDRIHNVESCCGIDEEGNRA